MFDQQEEDCYHGGFVVKHNIQLIYNSFDRHIPEPNTHRNGKQYIFFCNRICSSHFLVILLRGSVSRLYLQPKRLQVLFPLGETADDYRVDCERRGLLSDNDPIHWICIIVFHVFTTTMKRSTSNTTHLLNLLCNTKECS